MAAVSSKRIGCTAWKKRSFFHALGEKPTNSPGQELHPYFLQTASARQRNHYVRHYVVHYSFHYVVKKMVQHI